MFGKRAVVESLTKGTTLACQDYLKRIIEGEPNPEDLEDRALYFANAFQQVRGMEHLVRFQASAIGDNTLLIPISSLLSEVEKMVNFNLEKLNSVTK